MAAPFFESYEDGIAGDDRPVLLYLPGIEGSALSLSKQTERLSAVFDVRWLTVPLDDRTPFEELVEIVRGKIAAETSSGGVYVAGESFGGVLALNVALGSTGRPPAGLKGLVLINPATSVTESWPSTLPPLLSALERLPDGLSDAAYFSLATPIFAWLVGDPLRLNSMPDDDKLLPPVRLATVVGRSAAQLPQLLELGRTLPLSTLAYRLPQLVRAAEASSSLNLRKISLPVDILASTEDRVLPSTREARRLARRLPNAKVVELEGSGHVPLLEGDVSLADLVAKSSLLSRHAAKPKDFIGGWTPPSEAKLKNATASLANIRRVTSPIFLSTTADGTRVRGLGALPPLATSAAAAKPVAVAVVTPVGVQEAAAAVEEMAMGVADWQDEH